MALVIWNYNTLAMKIAVIFFGITRSLSFTLPSIKTNVLGPAEIMGDTRLFGHFFSNGAIDNPRSGELGSYNVDEYKLLDLDVVELQEPEKFLVELDFEKICSYGDSWSDGFRSLKNLMHQLYSLRVATDLALKEDADIYIFCRPDLEYQDSFEPVLRRAAGRTVPTAFIPFWQWHSGLNDRFSVCFGREAAAAYGHRLNQVDAFFEAYDEPLHSEKLLHFALLGSRIKVRPVSLRASRIRIDGQMKSESFSPLHGLGVRGLLKTVQTLARSL